MSRAASPFTGRRYGVVRVTCAWEMARSSFYYQREIAAQPGRVLGRRGPKTAWSDAALLEKIREVLTASPFYGEGHRKVWARLRFQGVRTSKARVLRLMREAHLLAPSRMFPKAENLHTGTIITARPNEVWASDHTMTATVEEGQVTVFVAVDHCTTECVGLHTAKKATRFEAVEPLRQGVRDYCGGFRAGAAAGKIAIAETYPAEYYGWFPPEPLRGKGKVEIRRVVGSHLTNWAASLDLSLEPTLLCMIEKGFPEGDDAFDAVVGLFGMIEVVTGRRQSGEPSGDRITMLEGWILGQVAAPA